MLQITTDELKCTHWPCEVACELCDTVYHFKCASVKADNSDSKWICHSCVMFNLPYRDQAITTESRGLTQIINDNRLSDQYLDPSDYNDESRNLLNTEGIDADLNYLNSTSTFSSMYKDVSELRDFSNSLNHVNQICIAHINCRSMNHKISDIEHLLIHTKCAVMAVTETWLTDDLASTINIPGYNFVHRARSSGIRGGVGFLIRSDIEFFRIEDMPGSNVDTFESLFIKFPQPRSKDIVMGSIYRPPNTSISDFLVDFNLTLQHLARSNKRAVLLGDYNINILRHEELHLTGMFLNTLASHKFIPTILRPTRITEHTATLIDNMFTNCFDLSMDSCLLIDDISDHLPILLYMDSNSPLKKPYDNPAKRNFSDLAVTEFANSLHLTDWSFIDELITTENVDTVYEAFISKYKALYDSAFPLRHEDKRGHRYGPRQPWMSSALLKSCKKKATLYKKYLKSPTAMNKQIFTRYRNKFKVIRRESESRYYAERFSLCTENLTKTWQIIKQILHSKSDPGISDTFVIGEDESNDPLLIAKTFNDYFTNVGPSLAKKIPHATRSPEAFMPYPMSCSLGLLPTSQAEIMEVVALLKSSASTGADGINPSIAKATIGSICAPLESIVNFSFNTGQVPADLKLAKIIPIYKAGAKNMVTNYRPISILPFFSKILEKLMANRLSNYMEHHALLSPSQFGFRHGLSTYMALLDLQTNISESINQNKFSLGVFFDISKAFDTVNHGLLINKLENIGIRGVVKNWFMDYLHNRRQYVCFKGVVSQATLITCGVPQGSILGSLLFLLYINDLASISSILTFILFADDTNVFFHTPL